MVIFLGILFFTSQQPKAKGPRQVLAETDDKNPLKTLGWSAACL